MPTEYSTLELNYSYKKVEYQEYEIKYSYDLIAYQLAEYNFIYNIEASDHTTAQEIRGYWSDHTQIVGNNLPVWHAGRYSQTSNYQQVLNSYGMFHEENRSYYGNLRKNMFIGTAETDDIYSGHICSYPKETPDIADRQNPNLIYNSDFSIPGRALSDMPCGWSLDKSSGAIAKIDSTYGLSAGNALKIQTDSGQYVSAYQSYNYSIPKGQDMVLSAMVNVPNNSSTVDTNASGSASLIMEALYIDGTVERSSVSIPLSTTETGYLETNLTGTNTSVHISYWQRIYTDLNLQKPTAFIKCYINSDYSNSTSDFLFYADCIQLEDGNRPTRWKKPVTDSTPWIYTDYNYLPSEYTVYSNNTSDYSYSAIVLNSNTSYLHSRPKTTLFYTVDDEQFYYEAIPTRLVSVNTSTENGANKNINGYTAGVYDTLISNIQYVVDPYDSSKIKKKSFELNDDYGSYSVAERDFFGTNPYEYTVLKDHYSSGNITYNLDIKSLTFNGKNIVAFCKESLNSDIYYTFKFIKPHKAMTGTYFECVQDYRVSDSTKDIFTGIETGNVEFNFIGKLNGEKNKFIIEASNGIKYEALFAYDYYIDVGNGQFLTREKYDQICIT